MRKLDLQTKIILVLISVIVPTFLVVTVLENQFTRPILEQELRNVGITTAEALAGHLLSNKQLNLRDRSAGPIVEREILERLYYQPGILRMDVFVEDPDTHQARLIASSVEDDQTRLPVPISDKIWSELRTGNEGMPHWEIVVPIKQELGRAKNGAKPHYRVLGMIHVLVSTRSVQRVLGTFWNITGVGAVLSVVVLVLFLNYFLKKTLANERLLRLTEDQNLQLSRQLHEAERDLLNIEKLAVMGQLTANLAHEIGTPLNAIGGHLQLLKEELATLLEQRAGVAGREKERVEIIQGELRRIEQIVKQFLQTTAKPVFQKQLVDLNSLIQKSTHILRPRIEGSELELVLQLDDKLGPVRLVPTDLEQVLLNLLNNSIDSLNEKSAKSPRAQLQIKIFTRMERRKGEEWADIVIYDTGMGIARADLEKVVKPFFTTKAPGEGTGLGLTISEQLIAKYGGAFHIDSKEGAWTQVRLSLPYRAEL